MGSQLLQIGLQPATSGAKKETVNCKIFLENEVTATGLSFGKTIPRVWLKKNQNTR